MILTPGAYIQHRRTAAGLTVEAVAGAIATVPGISEDRRAEWLRLIEADGVPMLWSTIVALRRVIPFDLTVLERLSQIAAGDTGPAPLLCRICAADSIASIRLADSAIRTMPRHHDVQPPICLDCLHDSPFPGRAA